MSVTAVGTGLPNHRLHQATGSISSTLSFPHSCVDEIDHYCLKTLTEDFLNFLNPNSSVTLSSACLSCLQATCALCMFHFIMMTMLLLCYACTWVLIPLLVCHCLGNSSPRFPQWQIWKNRLFTPSSWYNALSIIDDINPPGPLTCSKASHLSNFSGHFAFVSIIDPTKVDEAFLEPEWIQAM